MKTWVIAMTALLVALATPADSQQAEFRVIVNAANPTTRLTSDQVTQFFLSRDARWAHGPRVAIVDQSTRSPIRAVFTRKIMGKDVESVVNHWKQRMVMAREAPPPVKGSDADVIQYVAKNEAAIGYVSSTAAVPATVRVIDVDD